MKVIVIAKDEQLKNWPELSQFEDVLFFSDPFLISPSENADVCMDLDFENDPLRIQILEQINSPLLIINEVIEPLSKLSLNAVRINAWPGFIERETLEGVCNDDTLKKNADAFFSETGKKVDWVADITGMITPRVIVSIINEACLASEEKISTPEEIDTAIKLGVNYPNGPFEWADKIGWKNIATLLSQLSKEEKRYQPANLLLQKGGLLT